MSNDELKELSYSAYEEAMAFGLSHETFLRYFKTVNTRASKEEDEALLIQLKEALLIGVDCAYEVANRTHEELAGYKPRRHASVDCDVAAITSAIAAIDARLGPKEPT